MDTLRQLGIGIPSPRLAPLPLPTKFHKLYPSLGHTLTCSASLDLSRDAMALSPPDFIRGGLRSAGKGFEALAGKSLVKSSAEVFKHIYSFHL